MCSEACSQSCQCCLDVGLLDLYLWTSFTFQFLLSRSPASRRAFVILSFSPVMPSNFFPSVSNPPLTAFVRTLEITSFSRSKEV